MESAAKHATFVPPGKFEPLRWIGAYKLLKAAMALFMALVVLRWTHRDLPEVAAQWMERLHITAHSTVGHFISEKVVQVHGRSLRTVAVILFAYTVIATAEGVGLIMRRTWAEWLTVVTTAGFIPLEIYEVHKHYTWVRLTILVLNVAVLIYLVVRLRRDHAKRKVIEDLARKESIQPRPATAD